MHFFAVICFLLISGSIVTKSRDCYQGGSWISGTCYKLFSDPLPWLQARNSCFKYGGRLVKFDDIPQQTDVQNTILADTKFNVWIGLKTNVFSLIYMIFFTFYCTT